MHSPKPKTLKIPLFAVEMGEYCEYHVEAIFSTRSLAQAWIDKNSHPSDFSINEQWKLDAEAV
jgi:hypothetical protein